MSSVDERIVRMTFDNSKFEAGVQKTLETLANLKKALNLDKAGADFSKLEKASEQINFSHMSDALDQVSNRFSTFGIVGMTVLQNLVNSAINAGKKIASSLTSPIIEGGKRRALNIEQAKFQIEGLGYAWEDVSEDINYGVKSTAYGLDSAAKAASQLLASNVAVGDSMKAALRGISGVAAMTSSEYDDIARVFTTVAGNGRLMGDQLNQLSARGLNVAATLGKALGKTEGEIREMVSAGEIDFATFSKAMDDAFGEHAKKANDTFTGSLSNMKAALSRIGADFATPAYTNIRLAMNALTPVIDDVHKAMAPLVETASQAMDFASKLAVEIFTNANMGAKLSGVISNINKVFITFGKVLMMLPSAMEPASRAVGNFSKLFRSMVSNVNVDAFLEKSLDGITKIVTAFGKTIGNLINSAYLIVSPIVKAFQDSFSDVFGRNLLDIFVEIAEAVENFSSRLTVSVRMYDNIKKTFSGIFTVVGAVADIAIKLAGIIGNVLASAAIHSFGFILDVILKITAVVGDLIVGIKDFIKEIKSLKTVQAIVSKITSILGKLGGAFGDTFETTHSFLNLLMDSTFDAFALVLSKIASAVLFVAHAIDDAIVKVVELINRLRELPQVQRAIQKVVNVFDTLRTKASDVASVLYSKFTTGFNKAREVLGKFINKVRELSGEYITLPTLEEAVARFQEFVSDVFEKSVEIFEKVRDTVVKIVDRIKDLGEVSFTNVIRNLADLRTNIGETLDMAGKLEFVKNVFYGIRDGIVDMTNTSGSMLNKLKDKLSVFIDWLGGKFSEVTLGDIIAAGAGGSLIVFMVSFTKLLEKVSLLADAATGMLKNITALPSAVASVLKNFAEIEKAKAQAIKMESIVGVLKAVTLLAGAVALLATMDQEKVKTSAMAIGILGGSLVIIAGVMASLSSAVTPDQVAKSSTLMLAISGSVGILILALKILTGIDMNGIETRLIAMGILMAELAAFTVVLSRLAPQMSGGSVAIVAISISMIMLTKAFQNLSSLPLESVISGTILMGAMIALLALVNKVAASGTKTAASALAIIAVAAALNMIISSMRQLGEMDPEVAKRGVIQTSILLGLIGVLMVASSVAGKHAASAGVAMILVGVALHVIVEAIDKMAGIPSSSIEKAQDVVAKILILFGAITAMTKFAGKYAARAGAAIALMSGSMILLSAAMAIMAKIDPKGLDRSVDAITRIMAMFALIVASTSIAGKAEKTITTMTICVAALAGVLAILSLLEPSNLDAASEALTRLMAMFALLLATTKVAGKVNASVFVMLGVVVALGVMLQKLSELPAESSLAAAEALSLVLLAFSASLFIVQNIPVTALEGVMVLIGMITIFGLFLAAIGALNTYVPEVQTFLENGIPILEAVGEGIGSFVGGIINGVLSSASGSLPTIGENLSLFMSNIQGFIDGAKNIDESAENGIGAIVKMVLAMSAADFLDALTWWQGSGSSIKGLSENLPALGEAINNFAESMSGIAGNEAALEAGCNAISTLVNALPPDVRIGLGALAFVGVDYDALSDGLPKIGSAIKRFSENIAGMDTGSVENTQRSCEIIMALVNSLPKTYGGIAGIFTGGTFVDDFAERLPKLGHGLFMFAQNIAGMDTASVYNTQQACTMILDLSKALPQTYGGLAGMFGGGTFIDDFANQIPQLGHGLFMFAQNIAGMDTASVYNTQQACTMILALADSLPQTYGGVVGLFTGGTFVDDFAERLPKLGHGFFMYAQNIGGMDTASIVATDAACRTIVDLVNYISQDAGFLSLTRDISIVDMSSNLPALGQAFSRYAEHISGMDIASVIASNVACRSIVDLCNFISESTGFLGITRDVSMIDMSANLPPLASAFFMYAQNIGGMDTGSVTNTDAACRMIIDLAETISQKEGMLFTNQSVIEGLPALGHAFFMYAQNIAGMDLASVENTTVGIKNLIEFVGTLGEVDLTPAQTFCDGLKNIADRINNEFITPIKMMPEQAREAASSIVTKIGEGFQSNLESVGAEFSNGGKSLMTKLKEGMISGQLEVNFAIVQIVNGIITTIDMSSGKFTTSGTGVDKAIASGINKGSSSVTNAISNLMRVALNTISSKTDQFSTAGRKIVVSISSGIRSYGYLISMAAQSAMNSAANSVSTSKFYTLGRYAMEGLASGISDNAFRAKAAASAAASAALKAANDALTVQSPSKEFYKTGRWAMIGMANGISENAKYAERQSAKAATEVLDTANKIFDDLDMSSAMNYDPVIRPVVDMTNVRAAGSEVSSLMSSKISVGGSQEVSLASSSFEAMARRAFEDRTAIFESNNRVVAAVDALRQEVASLEMPDIQADVYMDSKKVGSTLAPEMNRQLGILAKRGGLS